MKNKFFINQYLSLGILFLLFLPAFSWSGETLNLDDCYKAALKRSEVLATQQELVIQAEESYSRAWGAILPSVNGYYSYFRRNASGLSSSGNNDSSVGQQTLIITASQPLFRGFRNFAAINAAKASITAQERAGQWAGTQLYRDVAQAYYTRLAVERDLNILDNELDLYAKRTKELQDRISIGRSRITELLTVQSAQAILRAQRQQISGQLYVAKEVLAFLTGLDQEIKLNDLDEVPTRVKTLESYQSRISDRPDIMAAIKNVEAFRSQVSVAKGAHLPFVDLIGNYYADRPDLVRNGDWDVGIAVILPIFMGGITSSNVKTAQSQQRQSELQLSRAQRLALQEIGSLYHNFKADLSQLAALEDAFNIAEKNYKANAKDYKLNLVTNLDVLQALTAYQDTQRSLEKIRYQTKIDFNQLEAAAAMRIYLINNPVKP